MNCYRLLKVPLLLSHYNRATHAEQKDFISAGKAVI